MDFKFLTDITVVPIESIKPHPLNDKVHTQKKLLTLAKAIRNNQWDQPIVVNSVTRVITKGHARWMAARDILKLKTVPVILKDYSNDDEQLLDLKLDNEVSEIDHSYDPNMTAKIMSKIGPQMQRALDETVKDIRNKISKSQAAIQESIDESNRSRQEHNDRLQAEQLQRQAEMQKYDSMKKEKSNGDVFTTIPENEYKGPANEIINKEIIGSMKFEDAKEDQNKTSNSRNIIILECPTAEIKEEVRKKIRADLGQLGVKVH